MNTSHLVPSELHETFSSPELMRQFFASKDEEFWLDEGAKTTLALFKEAVSDVPAYSRFLKEQGQATEITHIEEYAALPSTTKANYYDVHSLPDLVLGGKLSSNYLICTSSGSSGKPHYWPRFKQQDKFESALIELAYSFLEIENRSTLIISCLALGTWVAANMMNNGSIDIARKANHEITLITPGVNVKQIIDIVKDIGHNFDQIILIAYPPTARNVIIEGEQAGIDWNRFNPKFVVGGEPISQQWKDFMLEKVGSHRLMDIMVIFGMAEMHIVGFETPIAAVIRRMMYHNRSISRHIFGNHSLASLMQYNPLFRWIEEEDGELVISAKCGVPLMKYRSHDLGGVITFGELSEKLQEAGLDLKEALEQEGYSWNEVWKWPFFYSFGRGDCVSILGANIYPAHIEAFFHKHDHILDYKLAVEHDEAEQSRLVVYLELRSGVELSEEARRYFEEASQAEILQLFINNNDDYADAYHEDPVSMTPLVNVVNYKQGPFNVPQIKQSHIVSYKS